MTSRSRSIRDVGRGGPLLRSARIPRGRCSHRLPQQSHERGLSVCRKTISHGLDGIISANNGLHSLYRRCRVWSYRGATLESDPDVPMRGVPAPSKRNSATSSRAFSPETSGLVCVFSLYTIGQIKRRHHPNTEPCGTHTAVKSNTVDLVSSGIANRGQLPQQEKGTE
jgi:hypothetical protein